MKFRLFTLLIALGLTGCISSNNPPPPASTTIVVPPTAVCPNGVQPPC
jgi:hypothetical protein